jgi:hypothetical protein
MTEPTICLLCARSAPRPHGRLEDGSPCPNTGKPWPKLPKVEAALRAPAEVPRETIQVRAFDEEAAKKHFAEYFIRNYPGPNTIISRPAWHAPKLFRAALYALEAAALTQPPTPVAVPVGEAMGGAWVKRSRDGRALPAGTKLYATPQPPAQPQAHADLLRELVAALDSKDLQRMHNAMGRARIAIAATKES